MKIHLAPMEGVVDPIVRDLLTAVGGIDRCVTEFVRVSQQTLPARVFYRIAPELYHGGVTTAGVPVYVQLLGSDADVLAANAQQAAKLGARGIDLNFGCPAKTVNRNRGGSVLLQEPELVHELVKAVRGAVPEHIPVTAKMRLGYEDKTQALENALAISEAGASELCVHARTKVEGYRPPAHWQWIAKIREAVDIKVIANGDVFNPDDLQRCAQVSGCEDIMIGRGLLRWPDLALQAQQQWQGVPSTALAWHEDIVPMLAQAFERLSQQAGPQYAPGRIKQWLSFLGHQYPAARVLFDQVKRSRDGAEIRQLLAQQAHSQPDCVCCA